jgi:CRISPR-associated protein Csm5
MHVGTGESYEPTHYVIEDGVLHEFDTGAAVEALALSDRAQLLEIGNRKPDADMIQAVQRFFYERRKALMAHAVQRIPVLNGVAKLYASRVGQTANREADGKKVLNKLEIDRTSFNPITRQPVLFGSSIKGAIRTALLDEVNGGARLQQVEDRRTRKFRDENNQELQNRLLQYRAGKFELDPLRLVQLADAAWTGEAGLPAAQVYLAVNRKKAPVVDAQGKLRKSRAEAGDLYQILECVPSLHYRAFSGQLNLQSVAGVDERDQRNNRRLPAADLRFDAARIAQACNDFYLPIFADECQLLMQRGYLDAAWYHTVQQLLEASAVQRGEAFLLRVGRHSGAESVTLNGVRTIKILQGKDAKPEQRDAAKTVWLAADTQDQSKNLLPFGWLLVEIQPLATGVSDWPELKTACEPQLTAARALAAQLQHRQAEFAQARREAEAKRLDEEAAARQAVEAAERKQREAIERQARLAQMTPNLKAVEKFKQELGDRAKELRGKLERQHTAFHEKAKKLAKDAASPDWTPEEKRAAAEAISEWLPKVVEVDIKDERKKLKLASLAAQGNQPIQ